MPIPIRDSERTGRLAWLNLAIIGLNTGIFIWAATDPRGGELVLALAVRPAQIFDLGALYTAGFTPLVTLVTSVFLHGGWGHLLGNMLYLWVFGDNIEDLLGSGRYLVFYLAGGVVAGLAHVLASPYSQVPTIGASGAVGAVLGAYLVSFPRARVLTLFPLGLFVPVLHLPARLLLALWFALQLWNGLFPGVGGTQPVAWWAHIGGFLAGMGLVRILAPARTKGTPTRRR